MSRKPRQTKKKTAGAEAKATDKTTAAETAEETAAPAAGPSFSFATAHQMTSEPYAATPETDSYSEAAAEDESAAAAAYGVAEPAPAAETPVVQDRTDQRAHAGGHDAAHDEHERSGFAATALGWLVGALVIAALTLWLAPKAAPHLPAGIAQWLQPGAAETEARIAALESRIEDTRLSIEDRVAQLEAAATGGSGGDLAAEIERISGEIEGLAGQIGSDPAVQAELENAGNALGALASRADATEANLVSIREEIAAMAEALAAADGGEGPSSDELSAAVAQLQSRAENVAGSVETLRTDLSERIGEVDERLTSGLGELRASLDEAASDAAAAAEKQAAAEAAARRSEAFAALADALDKGAYADELAAAEEVAGSSAPEALAGPAAEGVAKTSVLSAELQPVARRAVAEEIQAEGGDDPLSQVMTIVRSNVLSRPVAETEGDDIGAVLSRVDARLKEGDAAAAMTELETLPEEARASLGTWYDRLKERAAAERALAEWRQSAGSDS